MSKLFLPLTAAVLLWPALALAQITSGGILYGSSSSVIGYSAALTAHGVLVGGGAGGAPVATAVGTSGQVLTSNGAGSDPTFQTVSGTGSVTSVGLSVPGIFGVTGSPVTTSGTLGLTTTGTSGGVPYFSSTSALSSSGALTANALVLGGGAGSAPTPLGSLGTTTTVLHGNAGGAPTFGPVANADLTNSSMTIAGHSVSLGGTQAIACADLSTGGTGCSTATGTSGATIPLLNGTNTASGVWTFSAGATFSSGPINGTVRVVTAAGAITVTTADYIVCVNKTSGAATTVNLPSSPATGLQFIFKDCKGDAATNNITLTPASGNIDGASTYVMNVNHQSAGTFFDGTQWEVF